MKLIRPLGLLATLFALACTSQAAESPKIELAQPGAAGVGDTLYPGLGNGGYAVNHYALNIRVADDLASYSATTITDARATEALSRFNLDLKGTTVGSILVGGKAVKWAREGDELQITPNAPLKRGDEFTVQVEVSGAIPNRQQARSMKTLAVGLVHSSDWLQSVCQPGGAHRIAAFADHPSQKAPATITIAAPSRFNSISNGELTAAWPDPKDANYTVRRFESRQKLAPELLQIGVGHFVIVEQEDVEGVKLRSAIPTAQVADIEPQLATIPQAIQFLQDRLGEFPQRTYGIFASPIGIGGGLETQSITLMDAPFLKEKVFRDNKISGVVAHEVSHEYFGNSVSPRQWSDLWLNEGHATYYEMLWNEAHGSENMEESMRLTYRRANAWLKRFGPVAAPKADAFGSEEMAPYGPVAYQVGALALYALRQEVGDATFANIERAWVKEYRDSTAGTADYIALTSKIAGRDLETFLRSWLYNDQLPAMPNHPDWSVNGVSK